MSKKLIGVHNNSKFPLMMTAPQKGSQAAWSLGPLAPGQNYKFPTSAQIPDNSDSSKYFDKHHMTLSLTGYGNPTDWSFWNDDRDNYKIKICTTNSWQSATVMRGGAAGGDGAEVVIIVHSRVEKGIGGAPDYDTVDISAVTVTVAEQERRIAGNLSDLKGAIDRQAFLGDHQSAAAAMRIAMAHPAFQDLHEEAANSGFKSLALVAGGGASLGVGAEYMKGVLIGISDSRKLYWLWSIDLTLGVQEGIDGFVGAYLSTEEPEKVGGLEFFGELSGGVGVGMAARAFSSIGGRGWTFLATTGEELELSFGCGYVTSGVIG